MGVAPSNFPPNSPPETASSPQELTRDPYVLDFLDLTGTVRELDLEITLVQRVQALLLELGHGFAKSSGSMLKSVGHESWYADNSSRGRLPEAGRPDLALSTLPIGRVSRLSAVQPTALAPAPGVDGRRAWRLELTATPCRRLCTSAWANSSVSGWSGSSSRW